MEQDGISLSNKIPMANNMDEVWNPLIEVIICLINYFIYLKC